MNSRKQSPNEKGNPVHQQRASPGPREGGCAPSAAALRALFESAPVGIFVSSIPGEIVSLNVSGAAMFGYGSPEEFAAEVKNIGKQLFVFPEQREELLRRALDCEEFVRGEVSYRRRDGSVFIAHLYVRAIRDGHGEPRYLEGFIEDITERKRVEAALQQSEARYRTLVESAPLPLGIARDGITVYLNRKFLELFRCQSAEAHVGRPITDFWAAEYRGMIEERARRRSQGLPVPTSAEGMAQRADGSHFPVQFASTRVELPDGPATLAFFTDITELKETQAALQQSEARYRTLVENAPLPIGISRNGVIIYVNKKFLELSRGTSAEAQVGRSITDFWAPEYRGMIEERARRRAQGLPVPTSLEGIAQREDGSQFPVQLATTGVELPDGPATLAFFTDITELKAAQGELSRHREHLEDLVAARTAELHTALADLEHMSYSMVHDMRAPLRAMQGFAQLIQAECLECRRPPVGDYLQRIGEASVRLDRLITEALSYNKIARENPRLVPVDLGRLLSGMVHTYPNLQPPTADISIELSTELVVRGNESLLTQCFGNLLDNAVKFVAPGVRPQIRVWAHASARNGHPSNSIYIADNGIGIPKEAQENIFGMFQRMHHASDYPGTGIGLAIVKKAVERMGGRVSLESEPGRGSTFCVELPSAAQQVQAQACAA